MVERRDPNLMRMNNNRNPICANTKFITTTVTMITKMKIVMITVIVIVIIVVM